MVAGFTRQQGRKGRFLADNKSNLRSAVLAILTLDRAPCKSAKTCTLFVPSSYTCTHGGGEYCGKYFTERTAKHNKTRNNS